MSGKSFFDTNVLLYLTSSEAEKYEKSESLLRSGGVVSVQVLNEMTLACRRKFGMSWAEIHEFISLIRRFCAVTDLTPAIHEHGRRIAERYQVHVYDAMILASALSAGCATLYSEDMQDGLTIDPLRIRNPFQ